MGLCLNNVANCWRNNSEFTLQDLAVAAALYNGTDADNSWYWEKVFNSAFPGHASLWDDLNHKEGGYKKRLLGINPKSKKPTERYSSIPIMGGGVRVGKPGKLIVP